MELESEYQAHIKEKITSGQYDKEETYHQIWRLKGRQQVQQEIEHLASQAAQLHERVAGKPLAESDTSTL